jgi:tyrosyl-tRNA synthetase
MVIPVERQLEVITRNSVNVITIEDLEKKINQSVKTGKPLRVKLGIDPSAPDIHLGHTVVLRKLRQFQDLGHKAVLIIGDFTALIGDPSGVSKTRPQLTQDEVEKNAKTYLEQVGKIIDISKAEIVRNSTWLAPLTFSELINLSAKLTVAKIMQRDDFQKRFKTGEAIFLHEFLYLLMQAYDSVMVKADIEIGGTDQLYNFVIARHFQETFGIQPQVAITLPLLVGIKGREKMSKSLGNYIGVTESAYDMYAKIMSIPDTVAKDYFNLLTNLSPSEVETLTNLQKTHPKSAKQRLAREIVLCYHEQKAVTEAEKRWESIFSKREIPEQIEQILIKKEKLENGKIMAFRLLQLTGLVSSSSDAKRIIKQGGFLLNEQKITNPATMLEIKTDDIIKVGKKKNFFKIKLE